MGSTGTAESCVYSCLVHCGSLGSGRDLNLMCWHTDSFLVWDPWLQPRVLYGVHGYSQSFVWGPWQQSEVCVGSVSTLTAE